MCMYARGFKGTQALIELVGRARVIYYYTKELCLSALFVTRRSVHTLET